MNVFIYLEVADSSHRSALNHTANICRLIAHGIQRIHSCVLFSSITAASLTTFQLRLNSLWKEYEDESLRWLSLLITAKAVMAQTRH